MALNARSGAVALASSPNARSVVALSVQLEALRTAASCMPSSAPCVEDWPRVIDQQDFGFLGHSSIRYARTALLERDSPRDVRRGIGDDARMSSRSPSTRFHSCTRGACERWRDLAQLMERAAGLRNRKGSRVRKASGRCPRGRDTTGTRARLRDALLATHDIRTERGAVAGLGRGQVLFDQVGEGVGVHAARNHGMSGLRQVDGHDVTRVGGRGGFAHFAAATRQGDGHRDRQQREHDQPHPGDHAPRRNP